MFGSPFNALSIPVVFFLSWIAVTWIRAHYGYSRRHGWGPNAENMTVPPMFHKMLEKAMSERDTEIQLLRERIEVLEKIVTDGHKSHSLADEIERLRDKA